MCGRFTQRLSSSDVARIFGAHDLVEGAGEAYNVAPAQRVAVVVEHEEERVLDRMRWGLVPGWDGSANATMLRTGSDGPKAVLTKGSPDKGNRSRK